MNPNRCYYLNIDENQHTIFDQMQQKKLEEVLMSTKSLRRYETRSLKCLLPQILAAVIAASFNLVFGMSLAFSAILIPQIRDENEFEMTIAQSSWTASVVALMVPAGATASGIFMDMIGRLNTIKLAAIPGIIGWIMIALANDVPILIIGRLFTGLSAALGTAPAVVYITEIARTDMRGSLLSIAPAYGSLGMILVYLKGWLLNWRTIAWTGNIYTILSCLLILFIPESPAWLVSKGRIEQASKSLRWLNKYQLIVDNNGQTLSDLQLEVLQLEHEKKVEESRKLGQHGIMNIMKAFLKPTGYKPLILLFFLFFFQQFCGVYVTLFYSVVFFRSLGDDINPYLASVLVGIIRFVMSVISTYLLRLLNRRPLIIASTLGLSVFLFISAIFTILVQRNQTTLTWVPIASLVFYVISSMIGMLTIPWTMTAELFPIEIRGVAHSITYSVANLFMFLAVQSYETLVQFFDGIVGLQFFYATIGTIGLIYIIIFLPETHDIKLTDIEEYFKHNTIYLGQKMIRINDEKCKNQITRVENKDVKDGADNEQNVKLITQTS